MALGHHPLHSTKARPDRAYRRLSAYARHADGANMYCDTRLIADELDRRFPKRPLLRPQSRGLALAVEAWAERDLFWPIARYVSGTNADAIDPGLHADRAAMRGKRTPTSERLKAVARSPHRSPVADGGLHAVRRPSLPGVG